MKTLYFLKTDEIKGNSKNPRHRREIELLYLQIETDGKVFAGLPVSEIAAIGHFLRASMDSVFSEVRLTMERVSDEGLMTPLEIIEMTDVVVTTFQILAEGGANIAFEGKSRRFGVSRNPSLFRRLLKDALEFVP